MALGLIKLLLLVTACVAAVECDPLDAADSASAPGGTDVQQQQGTSGEDTLDVQQILTWATEEADIQCNYLAADDNLPVRGVTARWHLSARSVMISMPSRMVLKVAAGQPSPMPDLVPDKTWRTLDGGVQIALVLLREAKRGSASPWHIWIQSLPRTFSTLMHWTEEELQQLQMDSTAAEQEFLAKVKKHSNTVQASYNKLQRTPVVGQLNLSLEELMWAVDVATSRPFAIPEHWTQLVKESLAPIMVGSIGLVGALLFKSTSLRQWQSSKEILMCCRFLLTMSVLATLLRGLFQQEGVSTAALVPVLDLINHSSTSSSKIQRTWLSDRLEAVITHEVPAGQEIKHSYGAKPNEDFLQYYGFVDSENIHDAYSADLLQFVTQHFEIVPQKLQAVEGQANLHQALQQAQLTREGWSPTTVQALFQLLGRQAESPLKNIKPLQILQKFFQRVFSSNIQAIVQPQAVSDTAQYLAKKEVLQALYQFCQDTLSSKVTTLEADIAELQSTQDSAPRNERHMLALQFRIGKKQLLKSCLWQYDPQQLADT